MSGNCCTSEKERAVTKDSANCMLPSKNIGFYHIATNRRCKFVNHPYPDLGSFPSPEKPDRHTLEIPKSVVANLRLRCLPTKGYCRDPATTSCLGCGYFAVFEDCNRRSNT